MYKKVRCTCIVVVLPTKSIVVLDVLVAVASSDRKVPSDSGVSNQSINECICTDTFTSTVSRGLDKSNPKLIGQHEPRLELAVG